MFIIGMEQIKIEGEPADNVGVASRGAWDMPYSGTFNPNSSPMPFNYPGEPPRYLFDKDESGSGNLLFLFHSIIVLCLTYSLYLLLTVIYLFVYFYRWQ